MADEQDLDLLNPETEAFGQRLASLGEGTFVNQTPQFGLPTPPPAGAAVPAPQAQVPPPPAAPVTDAAPPAEREPAAAPSVRDYIADRLTKKDDELKGLQDEAAVNRRNAGLAEAAGQMVLGASRSSQPFNPAGYQFLHDNAKQPVADYLQRQDARAKAVQGMGAESKFQRESTLSDPTSMQSTIARRLAAQALAKYKEDPSVVDGMSAADLKEFLEKPLDQMEARDSKEAINKLKQQELGLKRRELDQARDDKRGDKSKADQDKALAQTQTLLESARGNPAAAQAERDIYAAQKADSLAKLYGDPNKLSPQMVQLLQGEVAKIAQGGSPTMHELEGLNVNTMPKMLAGAFQRFNNAPSPANAGEFVKQYQDYAHALTKDAERVISDKYERVIESNKDRLGDTHYNTLRKHYIDRFPKSGAEKSLSPEDKEAVDWAKSNPADPRSKQILQLHGM